MNALSESGIKRDAVSYNEISPTQRAFEIVEIIAKAGSASIVEIIAAMNMPRTTAHRIVNNLEEQGYIYRVRARGRYVVAPRLVRLAGDTLWAASTLSPAHAVLTEIARLATGTSSLAILQMGEVAYIDSAVADSPLMLKFQTGQRAPLYCVSSGKVFLANMDRKILDRYLATGPWEPVTRSTIVDAQRLLVEVEATRTRGYALAESEFVDGVVGAAVPVAGAGRRPIAALTVSVPRARQSLDDLRNMVPALQHCAEKLSFILLTLGQ